MHHILFISSFLKLQATCFLGVGVRVATGQVKAEPCIHAKLVSREDLNMQEKLLISRHFLSLFCKPLHQAFNGPNCILNYKKMALI